jgi:hypothetical protein
LAAEGAAKGASKASVAFQRGVQALAQYVAREGADKPVSRGHVERIVVESQEEPVEHRLGVWLSNTKSRRDKLTQEQRVALAELGLNWA